MLKLRLEYALRERAIRRLRRGFVFTVKPRTMPRLLLPCNWLATDEADTEVDI